MERINSIKNITYTSVLGAFLLFLPIYPKIAVFSIVLLVTMAFILDFKSLLSFSVKKIFGYPQLLLVVLFCLYLIGLLYSENMNFGSKDIEARLTFFIFPLLFVVFGIGKYVKLQPLFILLTFGCLISSVLSLQQARDCFDQNGWDICWSGSKLAYKIHINYLSFYYFMAVSFLWTLKPFFNSIIFNILRVLISTWLVYFILQFMSLGFITAVLLTSAFTVVFVYKWIQNRVGKIVLLCLSLCCFIIGSWKIYGELQEGYKNRYSKISTKEELYSYANETTESITTRVVLWDICWHQIVNHPFGVGTGDVKDVLIEKYDHFGLTNFSEKKLNPHNQYMQTALSVGWLAALVLIALCLMLIRKAFLERNLLLFMFVMIAFFNMFFESYLEKQAGIIFFSLMILLLDIPFFKKKGKD